MKDILALKQDDKFVDMKGNKITNFRFFINRSPLQRRPSDRVIVIKTFVPVKQVNVILNEINQQPITPQFGFIDPSTIDDYKKKIAERRKILKSKGKIAKQSKPYGKDEQKVQKAKAQKKDSAPIVSRTNLKRYQDKKQQNVGKASQQKKMADINITVEVAGSKQ